jgi:hypothetical protein
MSWIKARYEHKLVAKTSGTKTAAELTKINMRASIYFHVTVTSWKLTDVLWSTKTAPVNRKLEYFQ